MKLSKRLFTCALTGLLSATMVLGFGTVANAIDSQTGWWECPPTKRVKVVSGTNAVGKPAGVAFAVGHAVTGTAAQSWKTVGYHSSIHPTPEGSWAISTNGDILSGGPSCA